MTMEQTILEFLQSRDLIALGLSTVSVNVEVRVRGEDSLWAVSLREGVFSVKSGRCEKPSVIVGVHSEDIPRLLNGTIGAEEALAAGRIDVSGDLGLAMRLSTLISGPSEGF